jgi:hypothetical protein
VSASRRFQGDVFDGRGVGGTLEPRFGSAEYALTEGADAIEGCNALLKTAFRRCSRRAKGITGLCVQHRLLGCHAPWRGWDPDGHPVGMWHTVVGTREGGMGCA